MQSHFVLTVKVRCMRSEIYPCSIKLSRPNDYLLLNSYSHWTGLLYFANFTRLLGTYANHVPEIFQSSNWKRYHKYFKIPSFCVLSPDALAIGNTITFHFKSRCIYRYLWCSVFLKSNYFQDPLFSILTTTTMLYASSDGHRFNSAIRLLDRDQCFYRHPVSSFHKDSDYRFPFCN